MIGGVDRALAACQAWLSDQDAPESAIAAHEAGVAESDEDARRWVRRVLDEQDEAGSWNGQLLDSAAALLTVQELREAAELKEQDPGVGRGLDWIRDRRGAEGAWTDGCTPDRHEAGICEHFAGGFFSPGPPEAPYDETRLTTGAPVSGDSDHRFVASTAALRCLIRWGQGGRDAGLHLEVLRRVVRLWEQAPPPGLSTTALLEAVHALILSPAEEDRMAAGEGLRLIGGKQRGDGSWVDIDAFQALEVVNAACDAGIQPERSRSSLWYAARLLVSTQQDDGSWGSRWGARRALIGWRALRRMNVD